MIHISRPAIRATATKRCLVFLLAHIHVQICPGFSSQNIMKLMNWWIHVQRLSRFCSWTDCWRELRNRLWNGAKKILMNHSRFWISSAKKKNKYHPSCQCRKTKVASCQVHAAATGRTSGGPMGRGPAGPPGRNETRAAKFGTHSYRVWTPAQEEFPALRVDPFFPILENYLTIQELSQSYHPIYESMYSICWNHNGPQQSETGCNHSCKQTTSQLFLVVWFVFVLQ